MSAIYLKPEEEDMSLMSLKQFRLAWQKVQRDANNQIIAAAEMFEQYQKMLRLAKGNEQRVVVDLLPPLCVSESDPTQ